MKLLKLRPVKQADYGKWQKIEYYDKNQRQKINYKVMEEIVLGTEDVMRLLKISRRDLRTLRDRGFLEFDKIGGKCRYRMSAINKMLNGGKIRIIFRRETSDCVLECKLVRPRTTTLIHS